MALQAGAPPRPTNPAPRGISTAVGVITLLVLSGIGWYAFDSMSGRLERAQRAQTRFKKGLIEARERVAELEQSVALVTRTVGEIRATTIDVASVIEDVQDSVFTVADPFSHVALGTGFAAASDDDFTYVATNHHVIGDYGEGAEVELQLDAQRWTGTVFSTDEEHDLALIRVDAEFDVLQSVYAAGSEPRQGEPVIALGSPLGLAESATVGVVSAVRPETGEIQTDAPIFFGNSGGPLLNARGEVLGITSSFVGGASGLGFAVDYRQMCAVLIEGESCE